MYKLDIEHALDDVGLSSYQVYSVEVGELGSLAKIWV